MTLGRQKGSKAEREVAGKFRDWWGAVEPGEFVRTPLSGGWGGVQTRAGFRASGDLMTTAPRFPFSVEVKRREGWSLPVLIAGRKSPVWGWWGQAIGQAKEMTCTPLLIFRKNREPWRVLIPFVAARDVIPHERWEACWVPSDLRERGVDTAGVLPVLVSADVFFSSPASAWLLVARTFSPG